MCLINTMNLLCRRTMLSKMGGLKVWRVCPSSRRQPSEIFRLQAGGKKVVRKVRKLRLLLPSKPSVALFETEDQEMGRRKSMFKNRCRSLEMSMWRSCPFRVVVPALIASKLWRRKSTLLQREKASIETAIKTFSVKIELGPENRLPLITSSLFHRATTSQFYRA